MKVNVNQKLLGVDGVEELKGQDGRPLILKDVCINALLAPVQGDDEKKKWEKYEVFKKLRDGIKEGEEIIVELKAEEIAMIKSAIGKNSTPIVMGQCWEFLEAVGPPKFQSNTKSAIRKIT